MPKLCLSHGGRMGNEISRQLGGLAIAQMLELDFYHQILVAESGITSERCKCKEPAFIVSGNKFDLLLIKKILEKGLYDRILFKGFGMRLEYFEQSRLWWLNLTNVQNLTPAHKIRDNQVAVHIRLGDLLGPQPHPYHYPLPISYYEQVIDDLGKEPVFIGEFGTDSEYENQLRTVFSGARFEKSTTFGDWVSLLQARIKIVSNSSFSWTAAWLGSKETKIILPVAGIFHPQVWSATELIPWLDSRYEFRWLAPMKRKPDIPLHTFLTMLEKESKQYPKLN